MGRNNKQKRKEEGKSRCAGLWHSAPITEDVGVSLLSFLEHCEEGSKTTRTAASLEHHKVILSEVMVFWLRGGGRI